MPSLTGVSSLLRGMDRLITRGSLKLGSERGRLLAFIFHSLVRDESDRSANVLDRTQAFTVGEFRQFVAYFARHGYQFVSPDQVLCGLDADGRYVLITFDDGYYNNTLALPVLKEFQAPAVFYVSTAHVRLNKPFWWDVLYRAEQRPDGAGRAIHQEIGTLTSRKTSDIENLLRARLGEAAMHVQGEADRPFTPQELARFAQEPFVTLGNHTADHAILTNYSLAEAEEQIVRCQADLKEMTGQAPRSIAYPNGWYNTQVLEIARKAGLELGITVDFRRNNLPLETSGLEAMRLGRYALKHDADIASQCDACRSSVSVYRASQRVLKWLRLRHRIPAHLAEAQQLNGQRQRPIRLVIQQGALPKYRIPVFRALAARPGIDLKVIYGDSPEISNAQPEGFDGQYYPLRGAQMLAERLFWHRAQWDYATVEQTDVLMLAWDLHYAGLVPALLRARLKGVPTILWGHGYSKQERWWRRLLRNSVAQLATALLFYNHATAQRFVKAGWDPQRIFVALNALDQQPIQQARQHWLDQPGALAEFRRQHGLDDLPVILFVSRLMPENRADLLLNAVAELNRSGLPARAVIIGKGPDEPRLRGLADSLNLGDRVLFPGAVYDEMHLAPWFLSAAVFCYPANIGLSLLHAFGYALPVVTSDDVAAQNPEIEALRDGENGILYQAGKAEAMAGALAQILKDPCLRARLGRQAWQTATQTFTLSHMIDGFEAAVRCCAAASRRP